MDLTGGMIIMNERSDQKHLNPGAGCARRNSGARPRRRSASGRRVRFRFLFLCAAAAAALLCLPVFLARKVPEAGTSGPLSILRNDLPDSMIRIVNPSGQGRDGDGADTAGISGASGDADAAGISGTAGGDDAAGGDGAAGSDSDTPWYLLLVNRTHPLPDGWQDQLELTELSNGQSVDSRIYPSLQAMFDAMRADGVYPVVASGFRTTEKQQSLMDEKIASFESQGYSAEKAKKEAETWVAVPGTSEHQLGSAVDINADGIHSAGYQVYEWLDEHAHEYGFIHRYPKDKTRITGISNEPWHYRYVGPDAAAEIHRRGICLEEYLGETP